MLRKALLVVIALVALNALLRAASTGPGEVGAVVLGWVVFGYIAVRAWPGIRSDFARLRSGALPVRVPGLPRFGRSRRTRMEEF